MNISEHLYLAVLQFCQAREKMKLCGYLFDSGYRLHKLSAYPLFSGRVLDKQGKSVKRRLCVYEGKDNVPSLSHKNG